MDHGKRLFFGYAQGVGCCAMLRMWKKTGERRYFDYVEQWADSLINDKGEIHLYHVETYNLDYINSGKVLFDLYRETGKEKYKTAMDALVKQLKNHPRTLEGAYWHKLIYQHQIWLDGLYMASPFLAQYGAEFNKPEWIDEAVKQFTLCQKHTYDAKPGFIIMLGMKARASVGQIRKQDIRLTSGDGVSDGGSWRWWMRWISFPKTTKDAPG